LISIAQLIVYLISYKLCTIYIQSIDIAELITDKILHANSINKIGLLININ